MIGRRAEGIPTLYVSYFGMQEPLVATQVVPYLRELSADGFAITLLTFDPPHTRLSRTERQAIRMRLAADGIEWITRRYHKRPSIPATAWDVLAGAAVIARIARRKRIALIHARSHVAALMAELARPFISGVKVVFDVRGLMADEYVAGGAWRAGGALYRGVKRVERWLFDRADGLVFVSERARRYFFPQLVDGLDGRGRPVEMIPTCTDVRTFAAGSTVREEMRHRLRVESRRVYAWVGSLGSWYRTPDLIRLVTAAWRRDPATFFLCLTASRPELVAEPLQQAGLPASAFLVIRVDPAEVPSYLAAADVGISLSEGGFARMGTSPTKVAEYLASGLPVIQSGDVGDVDELFGDRSVGVLLRNYDDASLEQSLDEVEALLGDPSTARRCRAVAEERFDLCTVGGPRYRGLYERLLNMDERPGSEPASGG